MEKIGTILLSSLKKTCIDKRLMEARIFTNYESMVGEKISKISKPTFIQNNTLFIGVENHVWLYQLFLLKPDLMYKINSNLPYPLVKDIKFQICDIKKSEKPKAEDIEVKEDEDVEIPETCMKVIYNISCDIDDEDLRSSFTRLMIKDMKNKIKKGEKHCSSI